MSQPRRGQPAAAREFISRLLHRRGWNRTAEHRAVFQAWEAVAPDTIQKRTRPVSYYSGRLTVAVQSAPLLEELRCFRSGEFLNLLNHELGKHPEHRHAAVQRIEFRRA